MKRPVAVVKKNQRVNANADIQEERVVALPFFLHARFLDKTNKKRRKETDDPSLVCDEGQKYARLKPPSIEAATVPVVVFLYQAMKRETTREDDTAQPTNRSPPKKKRGNEWDISSRPNHIGVG